MIPWAVIAENWVVDTGAAFGWMAEAGNDLLARSCEGKAFDTFHEETRLVSIEKDAAYSVRSVADEVYAVVCEDVVDEGLAGVGFRGPGERPVFERCVGQQC